MDPSLLMFMVAKANLSYLSHCYSGAGPASTLRSICSWSTFNWSNRRLFNSLSSV